MMTACNEQPKTWL